MAVSNVCSKELSQEKRRTLARLAALSLAPLLPKHVLASAIHALPRTALIIGNSAYPDIPLQNPANDANAIATELRRLGFSIDLQINARRAAMENAVRSYSASLTRIAI